MIATCRSRIALAVLGTAVGIVVLAAQTPPPLQRSSRTLRSSVDLTVVTASVRDGDNRLVPDLPADAFTVYEDSEPQPITQFTNDRVPIGLGLLLDTSDSMFGQRILDARAAVEHFLLHLLAPEDALFVMTFNHTPRLLMSWTTPAEAASVRGALDTMRASGGTAIYDTVTTALSVIDHRPRDRAALVLISDGADTASDTTLRDLRSALLRTDAFIFAVAIDSPVRQAINARVNPEALGEVTNQTGGHTEVCTRSKRNRRGNGAYRRGAEHAVCDWVLLPAPRRWQVSQHSSTSEPRRLQGSCAQWIRVGAREEGLTRRRTIRGLSLAGEAPDNRPRAPSHRPRPHGRARASPARRILPAVRDGS